VKDFIQLPALCGFSCQQVIVLHNGMVNGILAGSNPIVFSRQLNKIVLKFKKKVG